MTDNGDNYDPDDDDFDNEALDKIIENSSLINNKSSSSRNTQVRSGKSSHPNPLGGWRGKLILILRIVKPFEVIWTGMTIAFTVYVFWYLFISALYNQMNVLAFDRYELTGTLKTLMNIMFVFWGFLFYALQHRLFLIQTQKAPVPEQSALLSLQLFISRVKLLGQAAVALTLWSPTSYVRELWYEDGFVDKIEYWPAFIMFVVIFISVMNFPLSDDWSKSRAFIADILHGNGLIVAGFMWDDVIWNMKDKMFDKSRIVQMYVMGYTYGLFYAIMGNMVLPKLSILPKHYGCYKS